MDPLAVFALGVATIAAANHATVMQQYAASAQYAYAAPAPPAWETAPVAYVPVAPAPAPFPGWVAGADVGAHIGALAAASSPTIRCRGRACGVGYDPRPVIAGAVIGGLIGQAASMPPPRVAYGTAIATAPAPAPAPRGDPAASRAFVDHWQNFMEPRR